MTTPDFVIIGAMKSGTTSLYAQLAAQEGVFMSPLKEPNYFSDDENFAKGRDWYGALFNDAKPGDLKGEASTHYAKLPTYPETIDRMADTLDSPRLIYVIRDPVTRALSHYVHGFSQREIHCDLPEAVSEHPELIEYGRYAMQIAPFIDRFGKDSILLTSLERMKADPQGELSRIGVHIGAKKPLVWQTEMSAQNASDQRWRRLPFEHFLVENPLLRALRRGLVPKSVRDWVRQTRGIEGHPDLPEHQRHHMEQIFLEDRKALASLFPGHPALTDAYPFAPA
ncbi:MAG: sulfotransferase [Pseudomonadota bacterium]